MSTPTLSDRQRHLITLTQAGLPIVPRPYAHLAEQLDCSEEEVIQEFTTLKNTGVLRRIGLVPNHYRLGFTANAMSVWDVDDEHAIALGEQVGQLPFVSHCYLRPRYRPLWPYNLFAMVHGHNRSEVNELIEQIKAIVIDHCQQHDHLYSTRILKKTGLRLKA